MAPKKQATAPASKKPARSRKKPPNDPNWKPKGAAQALRVAHRAALRTTAQELIATIVPFDGAYTDEIGQTMASCVADGMSLDALDEFQALPPRRIVLKWITDENHPFHKLYYEAKKLLVPLYEERALVVAGMSLEGTVKTKKQVVTRDGDVVDTEEERTFDNVERSKLMVGVLQWSLAHLSPKKHGRNPDPGTGSPNEQLKGLFDALRAGPVKPGETNV